MRRAAAVLFLIAATASAADLRDVKDPAKIAAFFPAKAKVRVVNIWATWCVPCVAEMPELKAVDDAFGSEVSLTGVSMDDMIPETTRDKVVRFLDRQNVNYLNLYYSGNADDLTDFYRFDGEIPVTIAFDRAGKELWRHEGPIEGADTIAELRKLLRRMQ
jgi:thiol-disulfide isomerase/thioredoxin